MDSKTALLDQLAELPAAAWRKSTKSGPYSDNCVEVAPLAGGVALRDTKDRTKAAHVFNVAEWRAFIEGAKDGEFDLV